MVLLVLAAGEPPDSATDTRCLLVFPVASAITLLPPCIMLSILSGTRMKAKEAALARKLGIEKASSGGNDVKANVLFGNEDMRLHEDGEGPSGAAAIAEGCPVVHRSVISMMTIKEELANDIKSSGGGKDELEALDALEREASEFNKDKEIDRILHAFRLDAYAVLDLQPGVPDSDIKVCYRKKSLLIHPDKTSNPSAPEAFDRLKKAQNSLMDEKERAKLDEAIADARMLLMRDRKLNKDSPEVKEPDEEFRAAWRKKTVDVLIDNEARRRKQMKAQMQEEGREQKKQDDEVAERKRRREHEVDWEKTRDGRIGSWRDFQQGKGKAPNAEQPKKKKPKMKVLG
ncbi:uncharacterized protein KY384_007806 [Bacidia gigantensis]|uniref:uncharacterized protein n=1 Tax=Bacidia gigantensis TaxID=2732470 RepID=UPI001D059717|nr:uncharacterized protein KY384_007806 [Bacidia gigantensis]KAG8527653.1 hypothetical protein KY384_007806 [Bacidia gigantensis]